MTSSSRVAAAALPLLRADQRHQVTGAGARIADTRRPTRAATRGWAAEHAGIVPFSNGGNPIEMPNFLHFLPAEGYSGLSARTAFIRSPEASTPAVRGPGQPRMHPSQQVPVQARPVVDAQTAGEFFVHFEPNRYRTFGNAGDRQSPRLPGSGCGENRNRCGHGATGIEKPSEPSKERANGQAAIRRSAFFRSPRSSRTDR